jgi:hypothetical protein
MQKAAPAMTLRRLGSALLAGGAASDAAWRIEGSTNILHTIEKRIMSAANADCLQAGWADKRSILAAGCELD